MFSISSISKCIVPLPTKPATYFSEYIFINRARYHTTSKKNKKKQEIRAKEIIFKSPTGLEHLLIGVATPCESSYINFRTYPREECKKILANTCTEKIYIISFKIKLFSKALAYKHRKKSSSNDATRLLRAYDFFFNDNNNKKKI